MIDIYYPSKSFFISTAKVWYEYLLNGFKKIGNVHTSEELSKKSFSKLNKQITAININNKMIWYDWCDFRKVHLEIKSKNDYYFKIMLLEGYQYIKNIFPIGQTVSSMEYFNIIDKLPKNINNYKYDVFFNGRVTNYALRTKAVELIKSDTRINSNVGLRKFLTGSKRPDFSSSLETNRLSYYDFILETLNSKLNLALPGVGEDWTWRHMEILGLGKCLIMPKPYCILPNNPKDIYIQVHRDLKDLNDKIIYFSKHDKEREEIARRGKEYFYKYLTPEGQAKWILEKIL